MSEHIAPSSFHIALTGHRPNRLAGYNLGDPFYLRLFNQLVQIIGDQLTQHEHLTLHSGMALGADTLWSGAALQLRETHPDRISFVAEIPFPQQSARWPQPSQHTWKTHVEAADVRRVYAPSYSNQALWARNEGMIDAAQLLIAVWDDSPGGGTAGAVAYAQRKSVPILRIDPAQLRK